jgi:hypothetical protein
VQALEPLALYDDFNDALINPRKWFGSELGEDGLDIVREAAKRKLRMLAATYGKADSDSGRQRERLRLHFVDPDAVTSIASAVRVAKSRILGCAANAAPTTAEVRIGGSFFNAGTPTPGSRLNDVAAFIEIERHSQADGSAGPLRVHAVVRQCTAVDVDEDCTESTTLFSQNMGGVDVGKKVDLLIQWDAGNNLFLFQRDNQTIVPYTYSVSDAATPGAPGKRLVLSEQVANCTAVPLTGAVMEVFFDNVKVNASAAL